MSSVAPDYILIGHLTADLTPTGRMLGGTVSYAARVIKAFGLSVGVLTSAAPAEPLLDQLSPYVDELVILPAESTSTFENIYGPTGRTQYIRGVAAKLTAADVPAHWLGSPLVHLAPLTGEVDPRLAFHFQAGTILLTLQGWLRWWAEDGRVRFKPYFDPAVLKEIDWVVFSEEDIVEAPELEAQYSGAVENLVITRAERGGCYYHQGVYTTYATPQVELVHPTGAGDVFAASLLASLHRTGGDVPASLKVAAHLAAISVTRLGLESSPTPDEVRRALEEAGFGPAR
jgi:sugar/nucleoside kinase (ribokinase family)